MTNRFAVLPTLLAAAISFAWTQGYAQDAAPAQSRPPQLQKATTLSAVVVTTGTRALDMTAVNSLAPIDVITPQDLRVTGANDLASALRVLLPSMNFVQTSSNDQGAVDQPAQLRGLSPDDTLVLINGKRQHSSSVMKNELLSYQSGSTGTDLAAIPLSAIQRIEVLRDGAAAQYGSDAIAGVINIILKGGDQHGSVGVMHGQYRSGEGNTWQGDADGGFALGQKGWVHLSVSDRHQDPTNRAGPDMRFPNDPTFGTVVFHDGLPLTHIKQGAVNLQYDLTPEAQLYGFSVLNKRSVSDGDWYRSLSTYANNGSGAVDVYPGGFLPIEHSDLSDDSEVLGLRGTALGWHYDLSGSTGGNRYKFWMTNTYNYSLGPGSPTAFALGGTNNREKIATIDLSREFNPSWLPNPLNVAWGLEYRDQEYTIDLGEPKSYFGGGSQAFSGFTPDDAGTHSRQNKAAYLDLTTDFTDKLTGELAVRHEKYSDFGSTTPWKVSGRYAFTDTLALRATASTGFRAPTLAQEFFSSTATQSIVDPITGKQVLVNTRFFPATNPAAAALGAQPLTAEQSHNYNIGLVYSPPRGLSATLDLYQITINNRIIQSQNFSGNAVTSFLASAGFPFIASAAFFTNGVDTRTRGADLVLGYPLDLGDNGALKLTGGVNYGLTDIVSVKPNPPQLGLAGVTIPVFGDINRNLITAQTPKTKVFIAANWTRGNWGLHSQLTRYGKYVLFNEFTAVPQNEQAAYLLDLSATYNWGHWLFTLGANNIANTYPDKNVPLNSNGGNFVYPMASPFGYEGAYYYGSVAFSW
ncbi:MAG: TonB-dependent receptor [Rhodanobacter sp.]|nr:MAG: TonB-dependent receptor [Rhodanobacter sp.]TAL95921.1 MAG: TonB-dependent receptor [Rhodanobacter sp.]TAM42643.1 MAG: TonB-dependent receptor [Rhodanobacter sp.]